MNQALQLIKEAKEKKLTSLDLGNCGLTTIPKEVFELTHLEELRLCNSYWDYQQGKRIDSKNNGPANKIEKIPPDIRRLKSLKSLYLNGISKINWKIERIVYLQDLPSLRILDLSYNEISDISTLEKLLNLTSLSLSANNISDISALEKLLNLTSLSLSANNISDISALKKLPKLTSLDLGETTITDISALEKLHNLTSLNLSENNISDFSVLKKLPKLLSLGLNGCNVSDLSIFEKFPNLITLDASFNGISDLSVLEKLPNLTSLGLGYNEISNISVLEKLPKLTSLNLCKNQISDISVLEKLPNLTSLDLSENQIPDISVLEKLPNLISLDLFFTGISDISLLGELPKLTSLNLCRNQISDISVLEKLPNLNSLDLGHNKISDISVLEKLPNLTSLNLTSNEISDITPLKKFIIKGIPINTKVLFFNEYGINIHNNPLTTPSIEIVEKGADAVLTYFDELENKGKSRLYEAKLLIVGKGGAGKTSLATKLLDRSAALPEEEETTRGIDIQQYTFDIDEQNTFVVNVWDFGGQEIYHATHQFFLTRRSLYVLVDSTREDEKTVNDASFKYWLQVVDLFGGGSPLLILQNEVGGRSKELDLKSMMGQFDFIRGKYASDLLTTEGLDTFEENLKHFILQLPQVGQVLPRNWTEIRKALIEQKKESPYISLDQYYSICNEHEIEDKKKALELSQYFHDLGTCLHFQKDPLLKKTVILENEWATDAVYRVLDDETVKAAYGQFPKQEVERIWSEEPYEDMHDELLALMLKFELCYELPNKKDNYLIPQLLSESRPDAVVWDDTKNIQLQYRYDFMPKGMLSRLIVRLHTYLNDISTTWKKGMVLSTQHTFALVEEIYAQDKIAIRVRGPHQRDLMTIIRKELDELNSTFQGIKVEKLIPCNCAQCKDSPKPHFYQYSSILRRLEHRKRKVECDLSYTDVEVMGLMDNLFNDFTPEKEIRERLSRRDDEEYRHAPAPVINIHNEVHPAQPTPIVQPEMATTPEPPVQQPDKGILQSWWAQRLLAALGAGLAAAVVTFWFTSYHWFSGFLIVSILVGSLLLLKGDPNKRFFRAGSTSFGAALTLAIVQLGVSFQWTQQLPDGDFKLALEWISDYEWVIAILLVFLSGFLFYLDSKRER